MEEIPYNDKRKHQLATVNHLTDLTVSFHSVFTVPYCQASKQNFEPSIKSYT